MCVTAGVDALSALGVEITSFLAGFTVCESTRIKSRKIRVYPTQSQAKTLALWFEAARYCYNKTVEYLKQPDTKADWKAVKGWLLKELPERFISAPFHVKCGGVQDACRAVKNAKAKYRATGEVQEVGFRSRKSHVQTMHMEAQNCPQPGIWYGSYLGELKTAEPYCSALCGIPPLLFSNDILIFVKKY